MDAIAVNSIFTILGALLSLGVYILWEHMVSLLPQKTRFFGEWYSSWQPTVERPMEWVEEKLVIRRHFGKIKISNSENTAGYTWEGVGRIQRKRFMTGEWRSCAHGSGVEGVFMITPSVEGGYMCGFFLSPDSAADKLATGFVLSRDYQDLEKARECLRRSITALEQMRSEIPANNALQPTRSLSRPIG